MAKLKQTARKQEKPGLARRGPYLIPMRSYKTEAAGNSHRKTRAKTQAENKVNVADDSSEEPQVKVKAKTKTNVKVKVAVETIPCEWEDCDEQHSTPESLLEHICETHIGRKITGNLNLTCAWGSCTHTATKRDHITSHVKVHVPKFMPYECGECDKVFRRSQDLKKHGKVHARTSVEETESDTSCD